MAFWQKVKDDLEKGIEEGIEIVKGSARFIKERTEALTEEGKKRLHLFELKTKVKKEMAELGGHIYDLKTKVKNPLAEDKVKAIMERIKKMEDKITKLEGKAKEAVKKISTKLKAKGGQGQKPIA